MIQVKRFPFFMIIGAFILCPFLIQKAIWLTGTKKAIGKMMFRGKTLSGQLVTEYAVIRFEDGKDTFWINGPDNIFYEKGTVVPVRFKPKQPNAAVINSISGIWGNTFIYCGILLLLWGIVFLHKEVVPYHAVIQLQWRKPFISLL